MRAGHHSTRGVAGELLGQLQPHHLLRDASNLLQKLQQDEVFRDYAVARVWIVIPVGLVFVLISTVCAIGMMFFTGRLLPPPVPLWLRYVEWLVGGVVLLGGIAAQAGVFLIWMEERAARKDRKAKGIRIAVPSGVLAYFKYSRALGPWLLLLLCVGVPLAILSANAPLIAFLIAALGILVPVLYRKFDS